MDNCPHCNASLIGDPIPEAYREHYSPPYYWRREIGIERPELYDGIWEWVCPDCRGTWSSEVAKLRAEREVAKLREADKLRIEREGGET